MVQHYLYKIKCKVNDLVYWGVHSTTNLQDGYAGSGVALQEAKNKYGAENFYKTIMCFADTREKVLELERLVIAGESGNCLNKIKGGGGIKRLYTDTSIVEDSFDPLENVFQTIDGQYDVANVRRLVSLDPSILKIPSETELRKKLNKLVKTERLSKNGRLYVFPLKQKNGR